MYDLNKAQTKRVESLKTQKIETRAIIVKLILSLAPFLLLKAVQITKIVLIVHRLTNSTVTYICVRTKFRRKHQTTILFGVDYYYMYHTQKKEPRIRGID